MLIDSGPEARGWLRHGCAGVCVSVSMPEGCACVVGVNLQGAAGGGGQAGAGDGYLGQLEDRMGLVPDDG